MSVKKYRLKKSLPGVEDGVALEWNEGAEEYYVITTGPSRIYFRPCVVASHKDWFEELIPEEPKRDWEVVAYKDRDAITDMEDRKIIKTTHPKFSLAALKDFPIHSVRRLSDNCTFSIGDEVEYRKADEKDWNCEVWDGKIQQFITSGNNVIVEINDKHVWNDSHFPQKYLSNIRHRKQEQVKEFQWTDELVKEFWASVYNTPVVDKDKRVKEFKESKQSLPKTERKEVWGFTFGKEPYMDKGYGNVIHVHVPYCVAYENGALNNKLPLIKEAIEKILNDDSVFDEDRLKQRLRELELEMKAFKAGRETYDKTYGHWEFPTFEDYKSKQ